MNGIVGALPASQYKDPFKILIKKKDENGENTTVRQFKKINTNI